MYNAESPVDETGLFGYNMCKTYAEVYYNGEVYVQRGLTSKAINHSPAFKFISLIYKRVEVDSLTEFVTKGGKTVEKIELLPDDIGMERELEKRLKKMPLCITTSGMNSIEITNIGTNKGVALAQLCSFLHIKSDEVMAIGDNFNGMKLLNWAGVGVAVENADPVVKKAADFVTFKNNRGGVAHAIEHFALGGN